jgi:peptidoglycan hydrolase FlgJ
MDSTATISATSLPPGVSAMAAPSLAPTADPVAARKTAQDFEGFYLSQVFETMFSGVDADSMFGGGNGEQMFRSLLLQEYSKVAARSGGIGIADAVQREILQAQEMR